MIKGLDAIGMADMKLSFNVGNMLSFGYAHNDESQALRHLYSLPDCRRI